MIKIGDDEPVWSSSGSTTAAVAAVALFGNGVESSISGEVEQVDDDDDDDGALRRFGERGSSPSSSRSTPTRTMGLGRFEERLVVERGDNGMRSRESEPERRGFEADAGSTRGDGAHLCAVVFAAGTCEKKDRSSSEAEDRGQKQRKKETRIVQLTLEADAFWSMNLARQLAATLCIAVSSPSSSSKSPTARFASSPLKPESGRTRIVDDAFDFDVFGLRTTGLRSSCEELLRAARVLRGRGVITRGRRAAARSEVGASIGSDESSTTSGERFRSDDWCGVVPAALDAGRTRAGKTLSFGSRGGLLIEGSSQPASACVLETGLLMARASSEAG